MRRFIAVKAIPLLALCLVLLLSSPVVRAASDLADGTYTISYTVLKAEDDSASMANDYWEKPATLIVENGQVTVQMKLNHSQWVTQFKVPGNGGYVDTKIISSDKNADTRVTQFKVDDPAKPVISKIHVTVESIDYDHDYTIRLVFDMDSLKLIKAAEPAAVESSTGSKDTTAGTDKEDNKTESKPTSTPNKSGAVTSNSSQGLKDDKKETATAGSSTGKESGTKTNAGNGATTAPAAQASAKPEAAVAPEATLAPEAEEQSKPEATTEVDSTEQITAEATEAAEETAAGEIQDAEVVQAAADAAEPAAQPLSAASSDNSVSVWLRSGAVLIVLLGGAWFWYRRNKRGNKA